MPRGTGGKNDDTVWRQLLRASTVGLNMVAFTAVGLAVGYFLDKLLGTRPWLTIIFLLIGIAGGFRELFKLAKRDDDKTL
jgi:ATP synthase protein I